MNSERLDPGQDLFHIGLGESETSPQDRKIQQRAYLPGVEPSLRQPQQGQKTLHQGTLFGEGMFGERVGNVPAPGRCPEHGFNQRRILRKPWNKHSDIRRGEFWVALECVQQPVVKHFDFAHRTVAYVDLNRPVIRRDFKGWCVTAVEKLNHIRLNLSQQRGASGNPVGLRLGALKLDQLGESVTAEPAHGGQQAVALIQIGISLFAVRSHQPGMFAVTDDLGPVALAEIKVVDMHLGVLGHN